MLSIDEAINILKSDIKYNKSIGCDTSYEEQIADWLEELKDYRDKNKMIVRIDVENMDSIKDKIEELSKYAEIQYNKALDDFVKFASDMPTVESEDGTIRPMWLEEIAEQLKAGDMDEEDFENACCDGKCRICEKCEEVSDE